MKWKLFVILLLAVVLFAEASPKRRRKKPQSEEGNDENQPEIAAGNVEGKVSRSEEKSGEQNRNREGNEESSEEEESEEEEDEEEEITTPTTVEGDEELFRVKRGKGNQNRGGGGGRKGGKKNVNVKEQRNSKNSRVGFKNKPKRVERPRRRKLNQTQRDQMKEKCKKRDGGCKKQTQKSKERKEKAFDSRRKARKNRIKKKTGQQQLSTEEEREIDDQIEREVKKTFAAKRALLKAQGFTEDEVDPTDDGVWEGDMFLTENQADRIIAQQGEAANSDFVPTPPPLPSTSNRKKRYALYMEDNLAAQWDVSSSIKYVIDSDFSSQEKEVVKEALYDIESRTCINFEEVTTDPTSESYIKFVKEDYAEFCGLSYMGRVGDENTIWLNMAECLDQMRGTAAHETMHTLGVDHQQTRYDRNTYINVDYANIDPQNYDYFEAGDVASMSGYGVPYDFYSVMHYNAYVAANDANSPSMKAAKEPAEFFTEVMGQRTGISDKDGELLRKMYCSSYDCVDLEVWCGWWATDGLCETHTASMIEYCPKSCGFCPIAASEKANKIIAERNRK